MEATCLHGGNRFGILHKGLPNEGGTQIFGHQQTDAKVDAEDIRIEPVQLRVEGVAETVTDPGVVAISVFQRTKDTHTISGKEWKRPSWGARYHRSIDRPHKRRPAPGFLVVFPVRGGDAPVVIVVATVQAEAERFVSAGCNN